ncbi:MAG: sensor histidine kinase [Cyclobacteriaceae bacterium]
MTSTRPYMILLINTVVMIIVIILSVFFYREFRSALDERVLLQLTSIKRLKRVQIEEYVLSEWKLILNASDSSNTSNFARNLEQLKSELSLHFDATCMSNRLENSASETGIYDFSECALDGYNKLLLLKKGANSSYFYNVLDHNRIQNILLERTGMGNSGETYLVGKDYRMRSKSRFIQDKTPYQIVAKTVGVTNALLGINGHQIIEDYRGVPVYSAFHNLDIPGVNWAILSEIDVEEVTIPLQKLKEKLAVISGLVVLLGVGLSLFITKIISRPVVRMRDYIRSMSSGNYLFDIKKKYPLKEVAAMFKALDELKHSINEAIQFSSEIGKMNLSAEYKLVSGNDKLGESLIQMQEKLQEYADLERLNRQGEKKLLIRGQEDERKRLARELHDGLGPLLTTLKLNVQMVDLDKTNKDKLIGMIDTTIKDVRRITYDLMPQSLSDFGVATALNHLISIIQESAGIEIRYEYNTKEEGLNINTEIDICIFRICQELINNTLKHSGAKKIVMTLTEFDDKLSLFYADDGHGFDATTEHNGSGLKNMKERVEVMEGFVQVHSGEQGTQVEVEIPFKHG